MTAVNPHPAIRIPTYALLGLLLPQLASTLDTSIINVAVPTIANQLGIASADTHWLTTSYLIALAGTLILAGRMADYFGKVLLLRTGWTIFGVASLISIAASSSLVLFISRGLQGLGAAIITPAALAILFSAINDPIARARYLSLWSSIGSIGFSLGAALGGLFVSFFSWRGIFGLSAVLSIIGIVSAGALSSLAAESKAGMPARPQLDWVGALLLICSGSAVVYIISTASQETETPTPTWMNILITCGLVALTALVEVRTKAPLIPRSMVSGRRFLAALAQMLIFAIVATSGLFLAVSIALQGRPGISAFAAGLGLLPLAVSAAVIAQFMGRIRGTFQRSTLLALGFSLIALGIWWLAIFGISSGYALGVLPGLILAGCGYVPVLILSLEGMTSSAAEDQRGSAAGIANTAAQLAGAVGVALYLAINSLLDPGRTDFRITFTIMACVATAATLAVSVTSSPFKASRPHRTLGSSRGVT